MIDNHKEEREMPDSKGKKEVGPSVAPQPVAQERKRASMGIRLVPSGTSDQPVVANYTSINASPGMVFIDFGFLEPAMLSALPRVAKQGGKLPESLNGRLAVRVAMGPDALRGLKQQIDRLVAGESDGTGAGTR
jgi:hypothetical protein